MSNVPKTADPAIRDGLVEAAARLIALREPLTTRRVAAEVGASTMAVYTHFGSMEELRRAVRREGFARLAAYLATVEQSDDPLVDLVKLGDAYCTNALENPDLYRSMFMEAPVDPEDAVVGLDTFETLVGGVQRCIEGGHFTGDPWSLATQLWAAAHGFVALHIAQMLTVEDGGGLLLHTTRNLMVSFGAEPNAVDAAMVSAVGSRPTS